MTENTPTSFAFEKLKVWQEGMQWAAKVQTIALMKPEQPHSEIAFALRRAAREVPTLIAEGKNYYLNRIFQSFLRRSKAQVYRTASLLLLVQSLGLLTGKQTKPLLKGGYDLARYIGSLIRYLDKEGHEQTKPKE